MGTALTKTERKVMRMRSEGLYRKEIAKQLNCSMRTIDMHLYRIYKKIGVRNATELTNYVNKHMKED